MYKNRFNVYLRAENEISKKGFDIYVIDSGKKEFLLHHRPNHSLFLILQSGIRVSELERQCRAGRRKQINDIYLSGKFIESARSILRALDEYTEDEWLGNYHYDGRCLVKNFTVAFD